MPDPVRPKIEDLIRLAAEFLEAEAVCSEDHLSHNGRRSYVWPLMRWLAERRPDEGWPERMAATAPAFESAIAENKTASYVIYPGYEVRRNYSTNSIDCGAFVDNFHDFEAVCPGAADTLRTQAALVAHTYLARKLANPTPVHNQYLWSATGLARWTKANRNDPKAGEYQQLLADTLHRFTAVNDADGFHPYADERFLDGVTTYYQGKAIGYAFYVHDLLDDPPADVLPVLLRGARFLHLQYTPGGRKQISVETKRYYLHGPYELGSHPLDAFVFAKAYRHDPDPVWLDMMNVALAPLASATTRARGLASHPGRMLDWQCPTMRTGHYAWLTRIPPDLLDKALAREPAAVPPPRSPPVRSSSRLAAIGPSSRWVHFVAEKAPITAYNGQRVSGIVTGDGRDVNDLDPLQPTHYRVGGDPLGWLRRARPEFVPVAKHIIYHVWDCTAHKRDFGRAWRIFRANFLSWIHAGLGFRSTEFAVRLSDLESGPGWLRHGLVATDTTGGGSVPLGVRTVRWDEDGLTIEDEITRRGAFRGRAPEGGVCSVKAGRRGRFRARGPTRISYRLDAGAPAAATLRS